MFRMYFKEHDNREKVDDAFSDFVEMVFIKANKLNPDLQLSSSQLSCNDIHDLIINKPLLSSYWNLNINNEEDKKSNQENPRENVN